MDLSVIVPVYNVQDYLREALDSVLSQSGIDLEIIIVDDGSTDDSGRICDEYSQKHSNVVVIHQQNQGVSAARNEALKHVRGRYLTFLDADDYVSDNTYTKNISYLKNNKDVDALQFPIFGKMNVPNDSSCHIIANRQELFRNWWSGNIITFTIWNKIFKKEIFSDLSFKVGHVSEDTILLVPLYQRIKKFYLSNMGTYYYREREGSYTYQYDFGKHIDLFEAHVAIYQEFNKFPELVSDKVIAFTRIYRRLISAKQVDPNANIVEYQKRINRLFPSWKEMFAAEGIEFLWLATAKILGCKLFMKLFFMYFRMKQARAIIII